MPTKRTKNRHIPETTATPQMTDTQRMLLAKFACAVVAGGEKDAKKAMDKAEKLLEEWERIASGSKTRKSDI
jgi:hypothetical protein